MCKFVHGWLSLSPRAFNSVCLWIFDAQSKCVCLYLQRRVQRLSNREGKEENLAAESQSVNYLLIQFGRWLPKKVEGSSVHSSKEERGDNLLFQSPSDSHLCLTKCLPPIPGLWAMPDCVATSLSLCSSVLLSFHIACFHLILRISSMSSRLSLFLSAWHSLLSSVPDCQCISELLGYQTVRIPFLCSSPSVYVLLSLCYLHKSVNLTGTGNTFKSCCLLFACSLSVSVFCPNLKKVLHVRFIKTGIIKRLCTRAS